MNHKIHERIIGNTHNCFRLLASIITEKFDNTLKNQYIYYLRKESKKRVKKRQHKIKQTNYRHGFKETIKVEDKQKRYRKVETLLIKLFCNRDSIKFISKYEFKYINNIKIYNI